MAKGLRSKSKRKTRTEFRNTIGTEAHKANMAKIQEKLKATIESQSMKSLERISNVMQTSLEDGNDAASSDDDNNMKIGVDALETAATIMPNFESVKGENKAPVKKGGKRRKHSLKQNAKVSAKEMGGGSEKRRPKYFCQF